MLQSGVGPLTPAWRSPAGVAGGSGAFSQDPSGAEKTEAAEQWCDVSNVSEESKMSKYFGIVQKCECYEK